MVNYLKAVLGRIFGSQPAGPPSAPVGLEIASSLDAEVIADLRRQIDIEVAAGFSAKDEIVELLVDSFGDDNDPALIREQADPLLIQSLLAHQTAQAAWPETTDYDRLQAAFAALEAAGVISRQNFTCCGTCGAAEIWDEIDTAQSAGKPARGYAFFHMQDTEAAVEGHGLYLNYGSCDEGEAAAVAIGHEIVAQLTQRGLVARWDGRLEKRIAVGLDWKRRRNDLM